VLILVENLSFPFDQRVWREATALVEEGCKVTVISPKGKGYDEEGRAVIGGIGVYRFRNFEARSQLLGYALEYGYALLMMGVLSVVAFFREGFDVIHLCNPPDLLFLIALPYKMLGRRVVFDHHDLSPETYLSKKRTPSKNLVHRLLLVLERLTFRCADVVISTNRFYRELAVRRGYVSPDRVFVVRNGPNLGRIFPVAQDPALRRGKEHLVFYVGTMGAQDGLDYLLRAVSHLTHQNGRRDFPTLIMGGGPELELLKQCARDLDIASAVTFTGRVPIEDVREALSTADVCVCPDPPTPLNDVSTMNKTMEYMAVGKAIAAFDLRETRATAGGSALYARGGDAEALAEVIEELLSSPEKRARMGAEGRLRVRESFSWEHSKKHLWSAYEFIVRQRAGQLAQADRVAVGRAARPTVAAAEPEPQRCGADAGPHALARVDG
jgi:glycosyltransferase involved in cell wall biosynthesis